VPEGIEAELSCIALRTTVGRTVTSVVADDRVVPPGFAGEVCGATIVDVRRAGKIALLDVVRAGRPGRDPSSHRTIGLHFGMTGRVLVDGVAPIGDLAYGSVRVLPEWCRLAVILDGRPQPGIVFTDPRRLGRVSIDPEPTLDLGPDAFTITARELAAAVRGRQASIKSLLMDQHRVAGLGNLCVDEVLYWAAIDPRRTGASLSAPDVRVLATRIRRRLAVMLARGGSHRGTLDPAVRATLPRCGRDGTPLARTQLGGRTTVWCPGHQW
jgi:formamidopyrimidine-DNA glycosylase